MEEAGSAGTLRLSWSGGERGWNRGDGERGRNGGGTRGTGSSGGRSSVRGGGGELGREMERGMGNGDGMGRGNFTYNYSHITLQMLKNVNRLQNVDVRLHFLT